MEHFPIPKISPQEEEVSIAVSAAREMEMDLDDSAESDDSVGPEPGDKEENTAFFLQRQRHWEELSWRSGT